MATLNFDANNVEPAQSFEILPAGKYKAQVVASEMRPTKDGAGAYLWLEMEILDGEYAGRKVWDRLNIQNSNQQAVQIAERQLSALCHATGKLSPQDSEELHFIPIEVNVRVRPARENYDASNEVRGYASANEARRPSPPRPDMAPPRGNAVAAAGPQPWKQRQAG